MRRALALIAVVMLITLGVFYYLPFNASVVVIYRNLSELNSPTLADKTTPPMQCHNGGWYLSLEYIAIKRPYLFHHPSKAGIEVALLLEQTEASSEELSAESLSVQLVDDLGNGYVALKPATVTPRQTETATARSWRVVCSFPALTAKARGLVVTAQFGDCYLRLPTAVLPEN